VTLPVNLPRAEAGQLRDPQPRIEERPDDALLPHCLASLRQAGRFLRQQGLALELVGHRPSAAGAPPPHVCTHG